jgi:hypothetical protein
MTTCPVRRAIRDPPAKMQASRPTISRKNHSGSVGSAPRNVSAEMVMTAANLSASGSSTLPQPLTACDQRATRPSRKSVNAPKTISPKSHCSDPAVQMRYVMGTTTARRARLRAFGSVQKRPSASERLFSRGGAIRRLGAVGSDMGKGGRKRRRSTVRMSDLGKSRCIESYCTSRDYARTPVEFGPASRRARAFDELRSSFSRYLNLMHGEARPYPLGQRSLGGNHSERTAPEASFNPPLSSITRQVLRIHAPCAQPVDNMRETS